MKTPLAWVGTIGEGLWSSADLETWTREPTVPADARIYSLAGGGGALFAGGRGAVHRRSGGRWTALALPDPELEAWALAVDPREPDRVYAGCRPLALLASEDGGQHWAALPLELPRDTPHPHTARVTAILADGPSLVGGVEVGGVFRSDDGGKHWTADNEGLPSLDIHALLPTPGGALLAATPRGIARRDGRWSTARLDAPWQYCRALVALPDGEGVLCGLGDGPPGTRGTVVISEDDGRTWRSALFPGTAASSVWSLAATADGGEVLAAAIRGELYLSDDQGRAWRRLPRTFTEVRAVLLD